MFPIPWNFPFRKKDGSLTTISAEISGGGEEIPAYTVSDAGKVLGINNSGNLEWVTVSAGSVNFSRAKTTYPGLNATISGKGVN